MGFAPSVVSWDGQIKPLPADPPQTKAQRKLPDIRAAILLEECRAAMETGKTMEEWFFDTPRWARAAAVAARRVEHEIEQWYAVWREKEND